MRVEPVDEDRPRTTKTDSLINLMKSGKIDRRREGCRLFATKPLSRKQETWRIHPTGSSAIQGIVTMQSEGYSRPRGPNQLSTRMNLDVQGHLASVCPLAGRNRVVRFFNYPGFVPRTALQLHPLPRGPTNHQNPYHPVPHFQNHSCRQSWEAQC